MRILDAHTGRDYIKVGDRVPDHRGGTWELLEVRDRFFSASVRLRNPDGSEQWVPLHVRFTHPSFLLQRVGFVPT